MAGAATDDMLLLLLYSASHRASYMTLIGGGFGLLAMMLAQYFN